MNQWIEEIRRGRDLHGHGQMHLCRDDSSIVPQARIRKILHQPVAHKHRGAKAVVVLDAGGQIIGEYAPYLNYHGQPGVGDLFFKFLHDHMYAGSKVELVEITSIPDESRGFEELPANELDPSDRKLLATALTSGAEIVNALDTDWHEQGELLTALGVPVRQLCPEHGCRN